MQGLIVKGIGGFYYVDSENSIYECKGKGAFKNEGIKLQVGDEVEISEVPLSKEARDRGILHEGVINSILPRKNEFIRPPIVNVDTLLITLACVSPEPNFALIDKFLVMAEMKEVEAIIVINKCDLVNEDKLNELKSIYEDEYKVIACSSKTGQGIDELKEAIEGKISAFSGPSGVGKSSILNLLHPAAQMETGEISKRTDRGKHTTRHVEIFKTPGGGMVYDTPGFTSFEIMEADENELQLFYPKIEKIRATCKYDNCRHIKEPDCAVRQAVRDGVLNKQRYLSYKQNYLEIVETKKY